MNLELPYTRRSPEEYMRYMENRRNIIRKRGNEKQLNYDRIRKRSYDKGKKDIVYRVGEFVLHDISARLSSGNEKKFTPNFVGPYEITEVKNDGLNYTIKDVKTGTSVINTHVKHLKPFKSPESLLLCCICEKLRANQQKVDTLLSWNENEEKCMMNTENVLSGNEVKSLSEKQKTMKIWFEKLMIE